MSDTVKLIIEIPDKTYHKIIDGVYDYGDMNVIIQNGTPLDDVKTEIMQLDYELESFYYASNDMLQAEMVHTICREEVLQILDNIGKAESEDKLND